MGHTKKRDDGMWTRCAFVGADGKLCKYCNADEYEITGRHLREHHGVKRTSETFKKDMLFVPADVGKDLQTEYTKERRAAKKAAEKAAKEAQK